MEEGKSKRNAKMLQRHINLEYSCQKCLNKWKTENGLVKLFYNAIWVKKDYLWLILFKTVLFRKNCPKCKFGTRASSVWMKDVEKIAAEFGLEIVRKISETLNKLAEDSSKYSDLNYLADSTVLDLKKLKEVKE